MSERDTVIADLRAMLDWLEARPDVPMPDIDVFNSYPQDDRDVASVARAMGSCEKDTLTSFFILRRRFGSSVVYEANWLRNRVCVARKVGTRVVEAKAAREAVPEHEVNVYEWDCPDSILKENA